MWFKLLCNHFRTHITKQLLYNLEKGLCLNLYVIKLRVRILVFAVNTFENSSMSDEAPLLKFDSSLVSVDIYFEKNIGRL